MTGMRDGEGEGDDVTGEGQQQRGWKLEQI